MHTCMHTQLLRHSCIRTALPTKKAIQQSQSLPQMTNVLSELPCPPLLSSTDSRAGPHPRVLHAGRITAVACIRESTVVKRCPRIAQPTWLASAPVLSSDTGRQVLPTEDGKMGFKSCGEHGWKLPTGDGGQESYRVPLVPNATLSMHL